MNPHWMHDRFRRHAVRGTDALRRPSNDRPFAQGKEHRSTFLMRLWTRLHWSPADWQSVVLMLIAYGGLGAVWGAKQLGLFDLLAQMVSTFGNP